ncbi:MAG: phosphatase PAP2 family protein [Treponema sp.]|jgi:membrane-associated phospholipid phosphatase|nr:phosphatase PAP2 family protein [Treponema sp.]
MESTLLWGLDLIRSIQSHANPALTVFMRLLTMLGTAPVYLTLLSFIFWCLDSEKGIRLMIAVLVSLWINMALKFLLGQPRPFWEGWDPAVGMVNESLNGFPSGHAQISLTMWMILASWTKKKWAYLPAAFISLLVGFSRLYLGVHFPTDLVGGWILGALVLGGYAALGDRLKGALIRGGRRFQMILCSAAAFVMILYRPDTTILTPGALVLGIGFGYSMNCTYIHFRAAGLGKNPAQFLVRVLRFVIGIAGMLVLFTILSFVDPGEDSSAYPLFFFIRFTLAGFWVCGGAPWVFLRLRLAERVESADPASAETHD